MYSSRRVIILITPRRPKPFRLFFVQSFSPWWDRYWAEGWWEDETYEVSNIILHMQLHAQRQAGGSGNCFFYRIRHIKNVVDRIRILLMIILSESKWKELKTKRKIIGLHQKAAFYLFIIFCRVRSWSGSCSI